MLAVSLASTPRPTRRVEPLDEVTLRRAQRGEEAAWRVLVGRYQAAVHALVWRLFAGRARHRVEDLVQDTFVRVLRALPEFDPAGPATLLTWIYTIATRLALNELRRHETVALEQDVAGGPGTDAMLERQRLGAAIANAVAALPDAQRAVIVLREYHELDYAEIARIVEVDVNTVKSRLARARQTLREQLGGFV